jgi:hypothetical protein
MPGYQVGGGFRPHPRFLGSHHAWALRAGLIGVPILGVCLIASACGTAKGREGDECGPTCWVRTEGPIGDVPAPLNLSATQGVVAEESLFGGTLEPLTRALRGPRPEPVVGTSRFDRSGRLEVTQIIHPFGAADRDGKVYLFWGRNPIAPGETQVANASWALVRDLWMATKGPAEEWSPPVLLWHENDGFRLGAGANAVRMNSQGTMFLAAAAAPGRGSFIFGRIDGNEAQFRTLPSPAIGFLDLAVVGDSIWVGMSGVERTTGAPGYRPFLMLSENGGVDWSNPLPAPSLPGGNTQRVRVVSTEAGGANLIWSEDPDGGSKNWVIRTSLTSDRGLTWSEPVEYRLQRGNVNRLSAALSPCGWVVSFFTLGLSGKVGKVEWTQDGPRAMEDFFPEDYAVDLEVFPKPWSRDLELVLVYRRRVETSDTAPYRMAVLRSSPGRPPRRKVDSICRRCCGFTE